MNRYITTTLPYVNGDPHLGFALEIVQADTLARLWRAKGDEVFFSTGTDEHGQKIFEAAEKKGMKVKEYIDYYAGEVQKLKQALNLDTSTFIRTSDPKHYEAAQKMWRLCDKAADIYLKEYTGLYCIGCEAFKTEHEIVNDHCELHPTLELKELNERNYFFAFSKYQQRLLEYLEGEQVIMPEWRREEAKAFVESGLEDFSISRDASRLSWGVPVLGDDSQVMYVWFDALTNYISTLGWPQDKDGNFKKFWEDGVTFQIAGKDQVRFQSLMWQAMLMSADIKRTDHIFYHGFINSEGQRMSKSTGNVINPYELVTKYGTDATRYALLRHVHPSHDTDVTWGRLDEWYAANLVNGIGNLVARIMKLAEDHLSEPVALEVGDTTLEDAFIDRTEEFRFNDALDFVFEMVAECDGVMTDREPYKKVKSDAEDVVAEGKHDIALLVKHLAKIAAHLAPAMPETSKTILQAIKENKKPANLFPRLS